jgi:acetolactate synthase-1/2/3 large subunit
MTVADYVARFLGVQGVTHVFTVSGGMIAPLLDALAQRPEFGPLPGPRIVPMRHEQAAGFAAEGWARMTGIPGVALATSGPGATNLLTPLASCFFDSTPAVFITGQVPEKESRGCHASPGPRQRGFQETDICCMARPVTKSASAAFRGDTKLPHAFRTALSGRPGPVLVDLPFDVQLAEVQGAETAPPDPQRGYPEGGEVTTVTARTFYLDLARAERPLVLVGGGVRSGRAVEEVRTLLRALGLPVVHSLMAKDVEPRLDVGMIGTYGNRWANLALARCDFLLVLGSRLDVRQLGARGQRELAGKTIWRVDVDEGELNAERPHSGSVIHADLREFCTALLDALPLGVSGETSDAAWWQEIADWRRAYPAASELTVPAGTINPLAFLTDLSKHLDDRCVAVVTDVGSHQMWAAQAMRLPDGCRWLTSGGHGAMGFGLPAAIGAALAAPGRSVVLVTGDASLLMNVQELATLAELDLPVKIVVLDNGGHGMVREFQDRYFGGRHVATAQALGDWPGILGIARGFGGPHPGVLHVPIDPSVGVAPHMVYGKGLDEMKPAR